MSHQGNVVCLFKGISSFLMDVYNCVQNVQPMACNQKVEWSKIGWDREKLMLEIFKKKKKLHWILAYRLLRFNAEIECVLYCIIIYNYLLLKKLLKLWT